MKAVPACLRADRCSPQPGTCCPQMTDIHQLACYPHLTHLEMACLAVSNLPLLTAFRRGSQSECTQPNWGQRRSRGERPTIRFTPFAWSKLLFLRDCGETEVGGFGINATNDLLLVDDVRLVTQQCTGSSVQFTDNAVQELFVETSCDLQRENNAGRIWIHTSPGDCTLYKAQRSRRRNFRSLLQRGHLRRDVHHCFERRRLRTSAVQYLAALFTKTVC